MSIKIGCAPGAWEWKSGGAGFLRFVAGAEASGWDSLWLTDRLVSDRVTLEPVTALAAAAACTRSMKFGTSVLALSLRNPAVLAKELATLDFLSGGRLLPAVGLGGDDEREYEAAGARKQERGARTDEAIEVMRRLWSEDGVTHHGRFYHLTDVTIAPKPVFTPRLPLWIGGRTPHAWGRVARLGDGWLVSAATPDEVREGIGVIKDRLSEHGRSIDDDHYGVLLPAYLAASAAEAIARMAPGGTRVRPGLPLEAYAALGSPEEIMERVRSYVAAGATKFVFRLMCPENEAFDQMERLAASVVGPVNSAGLLT